jgi:regulator of sigma E protease
MAFCQFHTIALYKMLRGDLSVLSLGGPITIYGVSKMAFHQGVVAFLRFLAILSSMLAVVNVLPIPGLDGGHMFFLGIEAIRRKALSIRTQNLITRTGMVFLLLLMAQATINDIIRLF